MSAKTIIDLKDFYLAYSLVETYNSEEDIPPQVVAAYNSYLDHCREEGSEDTNTSLAASVMVPYQRLKCIMEGEDWAARLH